MSDTVTAYHGTNNLEGIVNRGALSSPLLVGVEGSRFNKVVEKIWLPRKQKYDTLMRQFAEVARSNSTSLAGFDYGLSLSTPDEVLADILEENDIGVLNFRERSNYKELKRLLFVHLTSDYYLASLHARFTIGRSIGVIAAFGIPKELLRPSLYVYNGSPRRVLEVEKEVPLTYLREVFVPPKKVSGITRLLGEHGLERVRVSA